MATVVIPYADERLTVEYPRRRLDAGYIARQTDAVAANDSVLLAEGLARLLAKWDLHEDGRPISLTKEAMLGLPQPLLQAIAIAVHKKWVEVELARRGRR